MNSLSDTLRLSVLWMGVVCMCLALMPQEPQAAELPDTFQGHWGRVWGDSGKYDPCLGLNKDGTVTEQWTGVVITSNTLVFSGNERYSVSSLVIKSNNKISMQLSGEQGVFPMPMEIRSDGLLYDEEGKYTQCQTN